MTDLRRVFLLVLSAGWISGCGGSNPTAPTGTPTGTPPGNYTCTLVVGFSQTDQWYRMGFESIVGDDSWEIMAAFAGVDRWGQPNDPVWRSPIRSACTDRTGDPNRVLLSVSGPFGADEGAWAKAIEDTLAVIRSRFLSVRNIVLQPVVGGPNHEDCFFGGERVRASWQHAHIDHAIEMVLGRDAVGNLVAGISPEVRTCDDYRDEVGHLTDEGAAAAAQSIGNFYRGS